MTLKLQTGGWYTLRVRARSGDRVLAETVVDMVGVGDVFITAGQSNSANAGEPRQSAQDNRVVYFDGRSFAQANDPIPGSFGEGGSPWSILGDMLVRTHAERWYASLCAQYNLANPVSSIPGLAP